MAHERSKLEERRKEDTLKLAELIYDIHKEKKRKDRASSPPKSKS